MAPKEEEAIHFVERNGLPEVDCRTGRPLTRVKQTERDVDRPEQTRLHERRKGACRETERLKVVLVQGRVGGN